jgi:hypothetical protein
MTNEESPHFRDSRSREQFRADMLASEPRWYSPWLHLSITTGVGIAAIVGGVPRLSHVRPVELLVVPVVFLLANLAEWSVHKRLLHRRWKPMAVLYDQHTPMHHRIYRYGDMEIRTVRELRFVLIPAMGVVGIVLAAAPAAALAGWLLGSNVGWLFLSTAALYVVGYELSHLAYHLPARSFVGRRWLVRVMREHHALHHDPQLMQRWNFNVTVPVGDWMFRSIAPSNLVTDARDRARARHEADITSTDRTSR